jgi:hypothetical protein
MRTVEANLSYPSVDSIKREIEWNAGRADELVLKITAQITDICREWRLSQSERLHRLIVTNSLNKKLIRQTMETLFDLETIKQVINKISYMLHSNLTEYDITIIFNIQAADLTPDCKNFEKYWSELTRTFIYAEFLEEIKQSCWSLALGDFSGWAINQALRGSVNNYTQQQWELKTILENINAALLSVEQKIACHTLSAVIEEIYRQFDQRDELLKQNLCVLQRADHFTEEPLHQVS